MALVLLSAAAARSGAVARTRGRPLAALARLGAVQTYATSPPPPPPSPPPPPPPLDVVASALRAAHQRDPAAATAAVLRGLPPHGRLQLLEALRRQVDIEDKDLELGRRSALRFGQQPPPPPPPPPGAASSAAAAATTSARAAAGAAADSAVAAEAAAHRAEAAAAESAHAVAGAIAAGVGAATTAAAASAAVPPPTLRQLATVALSKGIPFLVFGMFDNGLMIMGGGALEGMIGAKFGLSVLACSGLANTFADVFGLHISHVVEDRYKRTRWVGLEALALTPEQAALPAVRRAKWVGAAVGVATGCLIGLTPLLFMNQPVIEAVV
jgi:hypothetical protein